MALDDILRKGVATANKVTKSLQVRVVHYKWLSQTSQGKATYGSPKNLTAIVEYTQKKVMVNGQEVMSKATITFVRDVIMSTKDKLVLPDGSTGPIVALEGPLDPNTGRGYITTAYLGG